MEFSLGFSIGRLGVPLFLFLTGAIVLRKRFISDYDFKRFYVHNWLFLLMCVVIWAGLSEFVHGMIIGEVNIGSVLSCMVFHKNLCYIHWWYMPMIVSLYLIIPFLAQMLQNNNLKRFVFPMSVIGFVLFMPFVSSYVLIDKCFLGGVYGFYLIVGFFIEKIQIKKKKDWFVALMLFVICFLIILSGLLFTLPRLHHGGFLWYNRIYLLIAGAILYIMLNNISIQSARFSRVCASVSKASLGIYFLHVIVIDIITQMGGMVLLRQLPFGVGIVLLSASTFLMSWFSISLIAHCLPKFVRRLILHM